MLCSKYQFGIAAAGDELAASSAAMRPDPADSSGKRAMFSRRPLIDELSLGLWALLSRRSSEVHLAHMASRHRARQA